MKLIRIALVLCVAVPAAGASRPNGPGRVAARPAAARAATGRPATVMGSAWNPDNTPIPGAHVQLRDLETGRGAGAVVADAEGKFSFPDITPGTYVVELVSANGRVVSVGHPFVIAAGETVATFVRLGGTSPWYSGFFSNAAAAAASSAASQGITALAPVQLPLSAGSGS